MLLAEALAAVHARGLRACRYSMYEGKSGASVARRSKHIVAACALGAIGLSRDISQYQNWRITVGNDWNSVSKWDCEPDDGETLGHAYQLAMTQDVSDPETEQLIAARGAL